MRAKVAARQAHGGHDRHPEPRGHQPTHRRQVVGLEGDLRLEPGGLAQLDASGCACRTDRAAHERLIGDLAEGDRRPAGQRVVGGDGEHERLDEDASPLDALPADPLGGELDVGASGGQLLRHLPALPHGGALQHHPHPRVGGPEAADQPGHEPGAQAEREGQRDHAPLGVDQLVDRGEASSRALTRWSTCRLKATPTCVIRSTRPERRRRGVPTSCSRRASARETPGWLTPKMSLTSVTV